MDDLVHVRASVMLVGLAPGERVWVDPNDPQIARWLRGGQLIALTPTGKDKKPPRRPNRSVEQKLDPPPVNLSLGNIIAVLGITAAVGAGWAVWKSGISRGFREASEGWHARADELKSELADCRAEVQRLRAQIRTLERRRR